MSTEAPSPNQPNRQNLTAQGSTVAAMTGLSRLSGFVRDIVLSFFFGATEIADAFFVAFRIPNFFRRLFAEGAFSQAFIPILARYRQRSIQELHEFVAAVYGNLGLVVWLLVLIGVVFSPALVAIFAPGFLDDPDRFELTAGLVQITFPYLGFVTLVAFAGSVLNAHNQYAVPAFTPVFLNLSLICAALLANRYFDPAVYGLAWGIFVAGILQLAFQLPFIRRLKLPLWPRLSLVEPGVRRVGKLLVPAVFAASVGQINALIDTILASTLVTGSISWLYYSDRLLELPIGLVAVALGTVLLPNLSRLAGEDDRAGFQRTLEWGIRMGVMLGLPASVALYLLAEPLIATVFYHGALTKLDVHMTSMSLQMFTVGLVGWVLVKILAPAYFAREDTRTPFRIGVVAVLVNIIMNLSLFWWLGHVGLAIATSASGLVNAFLLYFGLIRRGVFTPTKVLGRSVLVILIGCAAMALVLILVVPTASAWLATTNGMRILWMTGTVALGLGIYGLVLVIGGFRMKDLRHHA